MKIGTEHQDKITFERVWVREAVFRDVRDVFDPPGVAKQKLEDLNVLLQVGVQLQEETGSAFVTVRCSLDPGNERAPFAELSVAVEGHFTIPDSTGQARLTEFARSQAPILLFPYVRQAISSLTVTTRLGGLVLPPVNMQQVVAAMKRQEEAAPK